MRLFIYDGKKCMCVRISPSKNDKTDLCRAKATLLL